MFDSSNFDAPQNDHNEARKIIFRIIAVFLMLLGFIGWIAPLAGHRFWSWRTELPNTEARGILVDPDGNIYCCSDFYGRIQKYHPDGTFAWGFKTGSVKRLTFEITGQGQLCIIESRLTGDYKATIESRSYYDPPEKLVRTEELVKDYKDYNRKMLNTAMDSGGNTYTLKGFLFPRVIKQTPSGNKTVLIHTPIYLWFLQAPFPAFAFFGISMMVLIVDCLKREAAKASVPAIDYFIDRKSLRMPSLKRLIILALKTLGIGLLIIAILLTSLSIHSVLFFSGLIGLGVIYISFGLSAILSGILYQWRCKKVNYRLWKDSVSGSSPKIRYEANLALRSLDDPVIKKIGTVFRKTFICMLWTWCILMILAICVILYLEHIGVWQNLINKSKGE